MLARTWLFPLWQKADVTGGLLDVRLRGDFVAKVVLPKVSKILRAVGAVFL